MRRINNGHPTKFDNSLGTAVAFDIENLQITYDLADGVDAHRPVQRPDGRGDLAGTGACAPRRLLAEPDSQGQHPAVSALAAADARRRGQFFRNTLVTQVSLRSLAFVDRYR